MASQKKRPRKSIENVSNIVYNPMSLLDTAAKFVAAHIPFQYIEDTLPQSRVPEPVEDRIVYWSFPRNEDVIRRYSSFPESDDDQIPFVEGESILDNNGVDDVLQIGFHLSGNVHGDGKTFAVSITFDRCKITSVNCPCSTRNIFWCSHIVALALFRIRKPENVQSRSPISETLFQMDREQLQKFAQYLISKHHTEVLQTAQKLADDILEKSSVINNVRGAPDPTAGASLDSLNTWHLDEEELRDQVKSNLLYIDNRYQCKHHQQKMSSIFNKVRELLQSRDGNGSRMLTIITQQFLLDPRLPIYKEDMEDMPNLLRRLWDELACLWVFVVSNPFCTQAKRNEWINNFNDWVKVDGCPLENPQINWNENNPLENKTIFDRCLHAISLPWNDDTLQTILKTERFSEVWTEDLSMSSSRVNSLRCYGYQNEARRLAVAIVRGVKEQICSRIKQYKHLTSGRSTSTECGYSNLAPCNIDSACIGNPLNPIGCLFDTLSEFPDLIFLETEMENDIDNSYQYFQIHGTNLTLAIQIAVFGLTQQRMKYTGYKESVARHQEKVLVQALRKLTFDDHSINALTDQVSLMFNDGSGSVLESLIHPDSAPIHYFAKFLFQTLLPHDNALAFKVGIRALRLPPTELEGGDDPMDYMEHRQCELATVLLISADNLQLQDVLRAVRTHMYSASQIFSLAQHAFSETNSVTNLKAAALNLGLMVLKKTKTKSHWRRTEMVRWVIKTAAPEAGDGELINIGKSWENWLTPLEACQNLAPILMNGCRESENLAISIAMQSAADDPTHCALQALTMCEKDQRTFSRAFQLVLSAAARLPALQLFAIARYLENRNQSAESFQVGILALKALRIAYNEDSHLAVNDIFWICNLALNLGKFEFAQIVPILVENIHCASILSEILRQCTTIGSQAPHPAHMTRGRAHERAPLRQLLDAAICAYVNTTHSRLAHISPRHYADFVTFLQTAQNTFAMAPDGPIQFAALIDNMRSVYKGKKKLMALITNRFKM